MAIKCLKCGTIYSGNGLPSKCGDCGNTDLTQFYRVDDHISSQSQTILFYRAVGKYGFLSNLYKIPVTFEGKTFPHSEAAYQFGKASDPDVAEWLIAAPKPHLCAAAAHSLLPFDIRENWNLIKVDRMHRVLKEKFKNGDMMMRLIETGQAQLVEDSKTDAFWGIGKKGNGKNMLGLLLMSVRGEIQGVRE